MAERVARHLDHAADMVSKAYLVALAKCDVAAGDILSSRAGDAGAGRFLDGEVPARVVGVPVGVPDLRDPPAALLGRGEDGLCIAGVDDRRFAAGVIVNQPQVIVGKSRDRDDL